MSRGAILRETLYYGSDRQQQYWENESQTLRIVREAHSLVWKVYRKERGVYVPVPARRPVTRRRRRKRTEAAILTGRSVEEVIALLRREHHLHLDLEQRLRRWIHKTSGERVLAFLDPNLGGVPVMTAPPQLYGPSQKKAPDAS